MNNISFKEAFWFWLKLGFISFGGPAGQIAIMHEYIVEKKKWLSESRFLHALNYCMLLPGPEAQQLATYIGWLMHGVRGGIVAGLLFILPSVFILLGLSVLYVTYGNTQIAKGILYGVQPAVVAIVLLALYKISQKALKQSIDYVIAVASLVALLVFKVPYPIVILSAVLLGIVYLQFNKKNDAAKQQQHNDELGYVINSTNSKQNVFSKRNWAIMLSVFILLWAVPFAAFYFTKDAPFWQYLSMFFTKAALVTFGGAYSVLLYVSQVAVMELHWLTQAQMVDGLALGESTPGPLIMVLAFVGFMGSYNHFNGSLLYGGMGLLVTTFFTFLPSFAFILLGAPVVERTQENKNVKLVLGFVTAAVVGVIANLLLFMLMALYELHIVHAVSVWHYFPLLWLAVSAIALKYYNLNMILWLGISAVVGIAAHSLV